MTLFLVCLLGWSGFAVLAGVEVGRWLEARAGIDFRLRISTDDGEIEGDGGGGEELDPSEPERAIPPEVPKWN